MYIGTSRDAVAFCSRAEVTFGLSCTLRHSRTILLRKAAAATVQGLEIKDCNNRRSLRREAVKDSVVRNHVQGRGAQCADIVLCTDV